MANLIVNIPDEMHRALKTKCATTGTTIRSTVIEWLNEEVKDELSMMEGEAYASRRIKEERQKDFKKEQK